MTKSTPRVVVIGLDGADPDLIAPWLDNDDLPNLNAIRQRGAWGRLTSTLPPMSAGAWTSFMTGKNPGKHGVFDFMRRTPGEYYFQVSPRSTEATLWGILSQAGKRVVVSNVPQTYPPESVNGTMISGLGTPIHRAGVFPDSMADYIHRSGFRSDATLCYRPGEESAFLREVYEALDNQFKVVLDLAKREPWDLLMHVFRATDEVAHFFWRYMDPSHPDYDPELAPQYADTIKNVYIYVDSLVGQLLDLVGSEAWIFVVSDHGMGPLHKTVYLNSWLQEVGLLTLLTKKEANHWVRDGLRKVGLTRANVTALLNTLRMGKIHIILKKLLANWLHAIPEDSRVRLSDLVDWSRTYAYSYGYIGQIYLNLMGREPQGIVTPDTYQSVCEKITRELYNLVDPGDGKPVVDKVISRRDIYSGPYTETAPDLIVLMRGLTYITHEGFELNVEGQSPFVMPVTGESAGHRLEGVLMAAGPHIEHRQTLPTASIIDITPTVLYLMGIAPQPDMDGHILEMLFGDDFLAAKREFIQTLGDTARIAEGETWTQQDEQEVVQRLRDLGYL